MAESTSLLFIPDISGFTEFIHETEIRHSQHIISELLEIMIDSNELDMILAEIEGDALFFYKYKSLPDLEALINQVKKIYLQFHHHLLLYEHKRICQCGACSTASKLRLKFVIHCGEFSFIHVKGNQKPLGPSVITVHRLLKNEVPLNEYLLISDELARKIEKETLSEEWKPLQSVYDNHQVAYHYRTINEFQTDLPKLPDIVLDKSISKYRLREEVKIEKPALDVYELITNFNLRKLWNKSAQEIIFEEGEVNRVGSTHTCVIDNQKINFTTVTQDLGEGKWVYGEQTENVPFMSHVNTYFILAPEGNHTLLMIDTYFKPANFIGRIMFPFLRKQFQKNFAAAKASIKEVSENHSTEELYQLVES